MAQSGFTPVQLYRSTTASAVPLAADLAAGELAININDMKLYAENSAGAVTLLASASGAAGDVVGPASSTDNAVVRFDGTTGKLVQNSVVTVADTTGNMAGVGTLGVGAITTSGALTYGGVTLNNAVTGTGNMVLSTSPTLVTPTLGVATATSLQGIIGNVTPAAGAFTTVDASGAVTLSGGTANGVAFLNGSKVLTTGGALTFDGTNLSGTGSIGTTIASKTAQFNAVGGSIYAQFADGTNTWRLGAGIQAAGQFNLFDVTNSQTSLTFVPGASGYTAFLQNNSEQMRLTSTGLGIGTSSPGARLTTRAAANSYTAGAFQIESLSGTFKSFITNVGGLMLFSNSTTVDQLTLDSSGNLGLGVTPVSQNGKVFHIDGGTGAADIRLTNNATGSAINNGGLLTLSGSDIYLWNLENNFLSFGTNNGERARISSDGTFRVTGAGSAGTTDAFQVAGGAPADAARIDSSGNFIVGKAVSNDNIAGAQLYGGANAGIVSMTFAGRPLFINRLTTDGDLVDFARNATIVGSISVASSVTAYNTTSDYRLKTVIGPVANAGQRIDALQPVEYTWNASGERTRGFLAHQFQEVYAGSVSGTKDAVDAEGKPVYQAMQASTSEVIADLVAEIKSLRQRLAVAGI